MRMSSNLAKWKRDEEEPEEPCEEDWGQEIFSNSSNGKMATFGQLSFSLVNNGLFTGHNVSDIWKTCAIDEGQESSASGAIQALELCELPNIGAT